MPCKQIAAVVLVLMISSVGNARGGLLFDNGSPDGANAHHSDLDTSSPSDSVLLGDDFRLTTGGVISSIHWAGIYTFDTTFPATDQFTIQIFNFSGSAPESAPLASFAIGDAVRTTDSSTLSGYQLFQYDAAIPNLNLAAGHYLLSIFNNTAGISNDWYWADSSQQGDAYQRDTTTAPWNPSSASIGSSFSISGNATIPDPASITLLGLAVPLIFARSRRPSHQ